MASLTSEQNTRLAAVVTALSEAWVQMNNPVLNERGMYGVFPRVKGTIEDIFKKGRATVALDYTAQAQRGLAANLRIVSGTLGHKVHFIARCTPAARDEEYNIEISLSPGSLEKDESALLAEGTQEVCEDLLGAGLLTPEGLVAFVRRQLGRANGKKPTLVAALAELVADELKAAVGDRKSYY